MLKQSILKASSGISDHGSGTGGEMARRERKDGTRDGRGTERSQTESESPTPPSEALPTLKRVEFLVLLVLADGESHGYRIVQEIARRTDDRVRVLPGNLYAILRRLAKEGLLTEAPARPAPELTDQRRRYYRITDLGKRVLSAEAELMRSLVQAASERNLIPGGASS